MAISFFANMPRPTKGGYLYRVSTIIRAIQIAENIGGKLNPKNGYEDDICIYVKPHVKPGNDFNFEGKAYLDIIDGWNLILLLRKHPEVPVITCSMFDFEILANEIPNKRIFIPQHHCNFERVKKEKGEVNVVGVIGTPHAFPLLPVNLESELEKRNIRLIKYSHFMTRQDIVDFYKSIDVQIVWRPFPKKLSNPLKIVNASSFGVPTIALDEPDFNEVEGCYIPVNTFEEFLRQLDNLRSSPSLYSEYSHRCIEKGEKYHIEHIAKLYRKLT